MTAQRTLMTPQRPLLCDGQQRSAASVLLLAFLLCAHLIVGCHGGLCVNTEQLKQ
jgi:hypothetical protein